MVRTLCRSLALAGVVSAAIPLSAAAAFFSFPGVVTNETPGPAASTDDPNFPPPGTIAAIELFIDDSDPSLSIADALDTDGFATTSIGVPGFLSGFAAFDSGEGATVAANRFAFFAYGSSILDDPGIYTFMPEGLNGVEVFYPALSAPPSTVGELVAAVSQPGVTGIFGFEAEGDDAPEQFYFVDAAFPVDPDGIVPLPATALLLGGGLALLGGFGAVRRRG